MTVKEILLKVDAMLTPETWRQHALAWKLYKGTAGTFTSTRPTDPKAICWCLTGMVYHVQRNRSKDVLKVIYNVLPKKDRGEDIFWSVATYNDSRSFASVKRLVKRALEAL